MTAKIHPIVISDHAPISLNLLLQTDHKASLVWRFNISLLKDPNFDKKNGEAGVGNLLGRQ